MASKQTSIYKQDIVWRNVCTLSLLHLAMLYGLYLTLTGHGSYLTIVYNWIVGLYCAFGVTAGSHRLWCHRSYKAKWPLRLILAIGQTLAIENDIYEWCRDHRVHHKYSETDADPHNSKRGFFFSHVGWLLCRKHPDVKTKGKTVDMSDLLEDRIVCVQRKYYKVLVAVLTLTVSVHIPTYYWNETLEFAIFYSVLRYTILLHSTWLVNSLAHIYGNKPYDKHINPRENRAVIYFAMGEGYHNYHHTFPWDYSTSEFGWTRNFNLTTAFIDLFALIGWAYERKKPSRNQIRNRVLRTGEIVVDKHSTNHYLIEAIQQIFYNIVCFCSAFTILMWPVFVIPFRMLGYFTLK